MYRTLSRKHPKIPQVSYEEITDAIVYAVISAELSKKAADAVMKRFREYFVDWNDLRVSRTEEIVEAMGKDTRAARNIASTLVQVLNGVFNQYHKLSLEALKKIGKRPAKQALEKIDGTSRFVVDYCMLTSLRGHAVPLTEKMLSYLRSNDLVNPEADEQQIAGFLAKQIPAKNGYNFYALLRRESEARTSVKKTKKTKTASKKKKKKKDVKKKAVKKKAVKKKAARKKKA